jgi:hypothetical protein
MIVPKPVRTCKYCHEVIHSGNYCNKLCQLRAAQCRKKPLIVKSGVSTVSQHKLAKSAVWLPFSMYIRTRDALKTTGSRLWCICITCGRMVPFDHIDAGHAIKGRGAAVLFDEKLVNGQCKNCNQVLGGCYDEYEKVMIRRYGQEWWDHELFMSRQPVKFTVYELQDLSKRYKLKLREL